MTDPKTRPTPPEAATEAVAAIEKYQPRLYRYLLGRLRGAPAAEDLAQDVYLRFLQIRESELVRKPQAYLYRIAANLVYEFNLRERHGPVTYDSDLVEASDEHGDVWADDTAHALETRQELAHVLARLPAMYQSVLLLRLRDGLSREEIASTLGISPQTVKKYLFRALAQCRATQWSAK